MKNLALTTCKAHAHRWPVLLWLSTATALSGLMLAPAWANLSAPIQPAEAEAKTVVTESAMQPAAPEASPPAAQYTPAPSFATHASGKGAPHTAGADALSQFGGMQAAQPTPGIGKPTELHASVEDVSFQQGVASWYGPGFHNRLTANGERYNMHGLTAAHKTLPFGTLVRVKSVDSGKSVVVRINDRGPYAKGRIIDLSGGAAEKLGMKSHGVQRVVLYKIKKGGRQERIALNTR